MSWAELEHDLILFVCQNHASARAGLEFKRPRWESIQLARKTSPLLFVTLASITQRNR